MHVYNLCHNCSFLFLKCLFSLAKIPNNNYLEEFTSIKSKKQAKYKAWPQPHPPSFNHHSNKPFKAPSAPISMSS